jgi:hypothetical protein
MAALMLQAVCLFETAAATVMPGFASRRSTSETRHPAGRSESSAAQPVSPSYRLDLSKSRAYDAALEILGAYKLTGNFHVNLETVLRDIGAHDRVTFEVEPATKLPFHPDCRHVVFRPAANVPAGAFGEIIRSIKARLEFDAARPWWVCSLDEVHARTACLADPRPAFASRCAICGKQFADDRN